LISFNGIPNSFNADITKKGSTWKAE
jgi:hypothetical protein